MKIFSLTDSVFFKVVPAIVFLLSFYQAATALDQGSGNDVQKVSFSSVYTDLKTGCRSALTPAEEKEAEELGQDIPSVCDGFGGYQILVQSHGSFTQLLITVKADEETPDAVVNEMLYVGDPINKRKVEWRLADGKPFAVIFRREVNSAPNKAGSRKKIGEVLRVIGLTDKEINYTIDVRKTLQANREARELADMSYSLNVTTNIKRKTYTADISRSFANPEEERLLEIAETAGPDSAQRPEECLLKSPLPEADWACSTVDGFPTPYALTRGTLIYYLKATYDFRKGRFRGIRIRTSSLKYTAGIKFYPDYQIDDKKFSDVYVAVMNFDWSHFCGSMCGLLFEVDRIVVLDKKGKILFIKGDKAPVLLVS